MTTILSDAEPPQQPGSVTVEQLLHKAIAHHQAGQLPDAERLYRTILKAQPNHPDANHNLGVLAVHQKQPAAGLPHLKAALEANPKQGQYWLSYIHALIQTGQTDAARLVLEQGRQQGLQGEAVEVLAGRLKDDAQLAAESNANNLGIFLKDQGRLDEAEANFRRALQINPDYVVAHNNLGNILQDLGRPDEAEASYRRALRIKPDYVEAHNNLGNTLHKLGRLDEAEASYRRALKIAPEFAQIHCNLGNLLKDLDRTDEAKASYRLALDINPDLAEAHSNLGISLHDLGRVDEAEASYRRALELKPECLAYAANTHLLLPVIPDTVEAIASWRERYRRGIAVLATGDFADEPDNLEQHSFYLAYHNQNDKPLMEALSHMFRKRVTGLTATAPHILNPQAPAASNRRIRVGFVSRYLVSHTIGKLFQGFIRHLDRRRFEVVVIHAPKARRDVFRQNIDTLADKVLTLPPRLKDQQALVMAERLDVLFYPDIGMDPSTYFLAYARLAPVQAVGWGHPDTTGLDSMDYFVSAASIEPPQADEHYTERLIRLNRMPCFYQPLLAPTRIPDRVALSLTETGTLYCCPQTLFKFHPDFDAVLAAIAEGDPDGHIVLIQSMHASWTNLLKARWAISHPVLLERVIFLPGMPLDRFISLLANIDVLLDPIHFGSGNTLYEAMVYGTPIVTWPGQFMRGRIVAGAYRQMGIADAPIAKRIEDYAPLALALGRDPQRRQALRQASMTAAARELFADLRVVREFEAFLEAAVDAASRRVILPQGWHPPDREVTAGVSHGYPGLI